MSYTKRICESIALLKTVYRIVGSMILVLGFGLTPVLPLLIKDGVPNDVNIYILYSIHLANTVVSYFFTVTRILFFPRIRDMT